MLFSIKLNTLTAKFTVFPTSNEPPPVCQFEKPLNNSLPNEKKTKQNRNTQHNTAKKNDKFILYSFILLKQKNTIVFIIDSQDKMATRNERNVKNVKRYTATTTIKPQHKETAFMVGGRCHSRAHTKFESFLKREK